jgi:hypothetical protein
MPGVRYGKGDGGFFRPQLRGPVPEVPAPGADEHAPGEFDPSIGAIGCDMNAHALELMPITCICLSD